MKMKKLGLLALIPVIFSGCETEVDPSDINSGTRITLSKSPVTFNSDGKTSEGEDSFTAVVTVFQGSKVNDLAWDCKFENSVAYAEVAKTDIQTEFIGTYEGDSRTVNEKGIELKVKANPEYKRSFTLVIIASDGTEQKFDFTQLGDKADAEVSSEVKDIEFVAAGGEQEIKYTTNMGDVYSFSADYEGTGDQWLTWTADASGSVKLSATKWTDKKNTRKAVFHITVGTPQTSTATLDIPVTQLAADDYYYMYGPSAAKLTIDNAIQMTKVSDGLYSTRAYFMNAEKGKNSVIFNLDSRTLAYPCFALAADGKIVKVNSEAELPDGPVIDIDGLRNLTTNFKELTWTWERVTTDNCMPDSELAKYQTKAFIARDGSMKVWMTEFVHWDGGDITPKLGSSMVATATGAGSKGTGGYDKSAFPSSWNDSKLNMDFENTEIGGKLEGTNEHGRIYAFSEIITGTPTAGIGFARNEVVPDAWKAGNKITDAVGDEYVIEYLNNKTAGTFTGDNAADEAKHPTLKMQIQGICPYGWHIANASDWLDIAYAASKASAGHTFPVQEDQVTYKQFSTNSGKVSEGQAVSPRGIGNLAPWLRNSSWNGGNISDGAEEFGFGYYPLGFRYMTQGYQCAGTRAQTWIPLFFNEKALYRVNVIINNTVTYAEISSIDNGQAIMPFRCVKNYK